MKLLLVLTPVGEDVLRQSLPEGELAAPRLIPRGYDPRCGKLALLGQDPRACWTGPAPWGVAALKISLDEEETAYLLSPVRVEDGVIVEQVKLGGTRLLDMAERLEEELVGEPVQVFAGDPPLLVIAEPHVGPSSIAAEQLVGRATTDLPAGPPSVLKSVLEASQLGCLEIGGRADMLFPHSPGSQNRSKPIRETWLGLRKGAVIGNTQADFAIAELLGLRRVAALPDGELELARSSAQRYELIVTHLDYPPPDLHEQFPGFAALVVAGAPTPDGRIPLVWLSREGQEVDEEDGVDLLKPLALGRGTSGRYNRSL